MVAIEDYLDSDASRKEKMEKITDFIGENIYDIAPEEYVFLLSSFVELAQEELINEMSYTDRQQWDLASDLAFACAMLAEKYVYVHQGWKCEPLVARALAVIGDYKDSQSTRQGKATVLTQIGVALSADCRYNKSIEARIKALDYIDDKEAAKEVVDDIIRDYKRLGVKKHAKLKTLMNKYLLDVPEDIDDYIDKLHAGYLKNDPVENTEEYLAIKADMEKRLYERMKEFRWMSSCHAWWSAQKSILERSYNITWRTPQEMNPRVIFD